MARPADPHAREALLAAARSEFAKNGLLKARVEDITAACGLSKGAFYLHFKSKEGAFEELMARFSTELEGQEVARREAAEAFVRERGQLSPRDLRTRSARYRDWMAMDVSFDERMLEMMWGHRETLATLLRGVGGTSFEGALYLMLEREVLRCSQDIDTMQGCLAMRRDIPAELVAQMIVGTYFLVCTRMTVATEKPDIHALALNLQKLIHEGLMPERPEPLPKRRVTPGRKRANVVRRES